MENREQYLATLLSAEPLIAQAIQGSEDIRKLAASSAGRRVLAARLKAMDSEAAHKRGEFIERQVSGGDAAELFDSWREHWGIPAFQEKLVDLSDFQNGFMWRFRDHTTSWSENQQAQEWFLTSLEAQTITRYELWSCDNGPDECVEVVSGSYKQILEELLDAGMCEVLISSVFTSKELTRFIEQFDEDEHDFTLEEIIEDYISRNPNFAAE